MITTLPKAVKLWGRGQLTIPKELRQALHLDAEGQLTVFLVGQCLVLTPKRLRRPSVAKALQQEMKAKALTLQDLLKALKEERRRYNREIYGL